VKGLGVTVLRVLNEEDHKKRNDRGASINDELPGVRKMKERPAYGPYHQNHNGQQKHIRMANYGRRAAGKAAKPEIEAGGFPDLLMGFKIRLAMVGGHG
jgi:hypothetical protein